MVTDSTINDNNNDSKFKAHINHMGALLIVIALLFFNGFVLFAITDVVINLLVFLQIPAIIDAFSVVLMMTLLGLYLFYVIPLTAFIIMSASEKKIKIM